LLTKKCYLCPVVELLPMWCRQTNHISPSILLLGMQPWRARRSDRGESAPYCESDHVSLADAHVCLRVLIVSVPVSIRSQGIQPWRARHSDRGERAPYCKKRSRFIGRQSFFVREYNRTITMPRYATTARQASQWNGPLLLSHGIFLRVHNGEYYTNFDRSFKAPLYCSV